MTKQITIYTHYGIPHSSYKERGRSLWPDVKRFPKYTFGEKKRKKLKYIQNMKSYVKQKYKTVYE